MFVNALIDKFTELGPKPALITPGREVSFFEFGALTRKLGTALREAGADKGSHVAILLPDSVEYCIAYAAIWSLGAVAVPLNMGMKTETAARLLSHSETEFLLLHDSYPASVSEIREAVPSIRWAASSSPGAYPDLESIFSGEAKEFEPPEIKETDTCGICYTSGTTGRPKGIVWNYRHLDAPIEIFKHFLKMPGEDIQICAVPLNHAGGLVYLLCCMKWGLPVVLMERFVPGAFLRNIEKYSVTMCFLVPAMFGAITRVPEFETADLSSLRWVATFGAMVDPASLEKLQAKCPDLVIFNGWGMMEAAPPNTLPHLDREEIDLRGVGFAPPWIEIKVVDEDGTELPSGEVGEVIIRGWVVMNGYYKEPETTAAAVRNGWLHSGDLGWFDGRGYLYVVGRKKDTVIVGGLNVQADEVEEALAEHPAIAEVAVTGVPDSKRGEAVKAYVVMLPGEKADEKALTSFCRSRLEAHKVPKHFDFIDRLPRTPTGKVAKWQLK